MFPVNLIKTRHRRMSMEESVITNINTSQKLSEYVVLENLVPLQYSKLNKSWANYAADMLKFASDTSAMLENKVSKIIANDVVPGIVDLSAFREKFQSFSNDMLDLNCNMINEAINKMGICDRILNNNETISRRFNFNKIINESTNVHKCVLELCSMIDTYSVPTHVKYNIALENILYSMRVNGKDVSDSEILEYVSEYFLVREKPFTDPEYEKMKYVLESSEVYDANTIRSTPITTALLENSGLSKRKLSVLAKRTSDREVRDTILSIADAHNEKDAQACIAKIGNITNFQPISDNDIALLYGALKLIPTASGVSDEFFNLEVSKFVNIPESKYGIIIPVEIDDDSEELQDVFDIKEMTNQQLAKYSFCENVNDNEDMKKLIQSFKAEQNKTEPKLKRLFSKLYAKSPENVIDEVPSLLSIIRIAFIGAVATIPYVGPVLALLSGLINWMIKSSISQKEADKLLRYLKAEKEKVEDKIDNTSDTEHDRYKQYLDELDKSIKKVEAYAESIDGETRSSFDDQDDFDDMSWEEATIMVHDLVAIAENVSMIELQSLDENTFDTALNNIETNHDIDCFYISRLKRFDKKSFDETAKVLLREDIDLFREFMEITYKSSFAEYADETLQNLYYDNYHKDYVITTEASCLWQRLNYVPETTHDVLKLVETNICNDAVRQILDENVSLNNVKLIIQNSKRQLQNVNTKIKSACQTANAYASGVINGIEKSMTSDRREAIIKGRILPSFTQMMKYAVTIAAAGVIFQPAGAIITAVGIFAINKSLTYREKKMILDEIETELKVVEKQIAIAENDQDMKQYRILLNMQKKLIRERQRIKYNMKAVGKNMPIPSATTGKNDD